MQWVKEIPARLLEEPVLVSVTGVSQTLTALMVATGVTLNNSLKKLTLIPTAAGVKWAKNKAAVVATSPEWPASGAELGVDVNSAGLIQLIATTNPTTVQVVQEG